MCLYPRLLKNKKYEPNKKNGGHVPPLIDERTLYVPIGCQNCIECDKQKRTHWRTRLLEEVKHNTQKGFFSKKLVNFLSGIVKSLFIHHPIFCSINVWLYFFNPSYRDWETDRKSTRLNSSHRSLSRMPSSA